MERSKRKEILEIALNNFDYMFNDVCGLCYYFTTLRRNGLISDQDANEFMKYFIKQKPTRYFTNREYLHERFDRRHYWWPTDPSYKTKRREFLFHLYKKNIKTSFLDVRW